MAIQSRINSQSIIKKTVDDFQKALFDKLFAKCHNLGKHTIKVDPYEDNYYVSPKDLQNMNNSPIDIFDKETLIIWNPYYTELVPPCYKCGKATISGGNGKGGYQTRDVYLEDGSATLVFKRLKCSSKDCSVNAFSTISDEYLHGIDSKSPGIMNDFPFVVTQNAIVSKSIAYKVHEHAMGYGGFNQGLWSIVYIIYDSLITYFNYLRAFVLTVNQLKNFITSII